MGISFYIEVLDPPLDTAALGELLRSLPGVIAEPDRYILAGNREDEEKVRAAKKPMFVPPLFGFDAASVWLAINWSDNPYDHGAILLFWVLDRYRCRGQESDYGSKLADNDAIHKELARWNLVPVPSVQERRQWLSTELPGLVISQVLFNLTEVVLYLSENRQERGTLCFEVSECEITGDENSAVDRKERNVLSLYHSLYRQIESVRWEGDGSLHLCLTDCTIFLAATWPDSPLERWTLTDSKKKVTFEGHNGGALRFYTMS